MLKMQTRNDIFLIANVHLPTSWMPMKNLADVLEAIDFMYDERCREGRRNTTSILFGGARNAHIAGVHMSPHPREGHQQRCTSGACAVQHKCQKKKKRTAGV